MTVEGAPVPTTAPIVVVSRFLPDPVGPAGSRLLHGFVSGARALGRDVTVRSWWPYDAHGPMPSWCRWEPLDGEPAWKTRGRALFAPRADVRRSEWNLPTDCIALAEEVLSAPAVVGHPRSVFTTHHLTSLDRRALGSIRARDVQDIRAERRVRRAAGVHTAYSQRVARRLGPRTTPVPAAVAMPAQPLPVVDEPVVGCIADWRWEPNRAALDRLLAAWADVCASVPRATLLVAGYGDPGVGTAVGVEVLGAVDDSTQVLARCAALVFPCPDTSGPKVKVMEAMSLGVPVVTTAAGVEGLDVDAATTVLVPQPAQPHVLADAVVSLLIDPHTWAELAERARAQLCAAHAPEVAAAARLAVIDARVMS